jgi:deoxycytidylate deaminase
VTSGSSQTPVLSAVLAEAARSTCQKRVVVCALYDRAGTLLTCESNRCVPPAGGCPRLGVVATREGYPEMAECQWEHAETRALGALPDDARPYRAVLYGHTFVCPACEASLQRFGVTEVEVSPDLPEFHGQVGLRCRTDSM